MHHGEVPVHLRQHFYSITGAIFDTEPDLIVGTEYRRFIG